jgi:hypothetical protein
MTTEAKLGRVELALYARSVGGFPAGWGYMAGRYAADGSWTTLKVFGEDKAGAHAYAARLNGLEQGQGEH